MPPITADQLTPGQKAFVLSVGLPALAHRLYDMGIAPGCELQLLFAVPGNDPLIFYTPACVIALRRSDCRYILVCP